MNTIFIILAVGLLGWGIWRALNQGKGVEDNKAKGAEFLKRNSLRDDVIETASGLQYEVLVPTESQALPTATSKVTVHYHGTLTDGSVFDSSVERGEPISFGLNQVIPGWTEGLQLMAAGAKYRLYIPSDLAYGNRAAGTIPGGSVLIFDVELISFE